jgi:ADP-ribose pyrophosphatase YjhB (NUDIX family)
MFTKKDEKNFLSAVKNIKNPEKGLPFSVFESLCEIVPFVGCEIIIQDKNKKFLLTWRNDKWWKGWHFPGGLLRVGETFEQRINKTAIRELGVKIKKTVFLKPINDGYKDSRGYGISLVFLCTPTQKPKVGKFFSKMPRDIIPEHKILWREIVKEL